MKALFLITFLVSCSLGDPGTPRILDGAAVSSTPERRTPPVEPTNPRVCPDGQPCSTRQNCIHPDAVNFDLTANKHGACHFCAVSFPDLKKAPHLSREDFLDLGHPNNRSVILQLLDRYTGSLALASEAQNCVAKPLSTAVSLDDLYGVSGVLDSKVGCLDIQAANYNKDASIAGPCHYQICSDINYQEYISVEDIMAHASLNSTSYTYVVDQSYCLTKLDTPKADKGIPIAECDADGAIHTNIEGCYFEVCSDSKYAEYLELDREGSSGHVGKGYIERIRKSGSGSIIHNADLCKTKL